MKTKTRRTSRIIKTRVFSAAHLRRYYPSGFERALSKHRENLTLDYVQEELMDSLKALCAAAGVKIRDYELGAYNNRGNNLSVDISGEDGTEELSGPRALAWIENRILGPRRAPWGLPKLTAGAPLPKGYTRGWIAPNGKYPRGCLTGGDDNPVTRYTRPGAVPDCPFTGICYDEAFLDGLTKSVKAGRTLKEAFEDLAGRFAEILEGEYEYQSEPEAFLEDAAANGWEYTAAGDRV